jgi:Pectate lyase superfamily protein
MGSRDQLGMLMWNAFFARCIVVTLGLCGTAAAVAQNTLPVVAVAASSSQAAYLGPQLLISNDGLVPDPANPAMLRMNAAALNYTSGYGAPNDEAPLVHFDFGSPQVVQQLQVWNGNEPGYTFRGFRDVILQTSNDGQRWATQPERYRFDKAPGSDGYLGQRLSLARPLFTRFIRLVCLSTWRTGGNADIASLGRVRFYAGGTPRAAPRDQGFYPTASGSVNVKLAPYLARGDGVTDDTQALQRAILDLQGTGRTIFLPAGTYLVSSTLRFTENASYTNNGLFGRNTLRGAGAGQTAIRLRDSTFVDAAAPKPVIATGFRSFFNGQFEQTTADWFNNNVSDLTIHIGNGNPGAKGMEFFSNNTGSVRRVAIVSGDGQGLIGLDLGHLDLNGPLLVKELSVQGFATGVRTAQTVNSQTFESITLTNQSSAAFDNNGQAVSIKGLSTQGPATALRNRYGFATLINASLTGSGPAAALPAITNGEYLFARNVQSTGFAQVIDNSYGAVGTVASSFGGDYVSSGSALTLFAGRSASLNLAAADTPSWPLEPAVLWANARDFRLTEETDDGLGLQRAIDSGAQTVFLPSDARIVLKSSVVVRGAVRRLVGFNAPIVTVGGAHISVADGAAPHVIAEGFVTTQQIGTAGALFEHAASRGFVLLDSEAGVKTVGGTGDLFMENVVGEFQLGGHRTFARQLNSEPQGTKISNNGGQLWVLGLKTERAGTLVNATGGLTEVLGGLCYTTTAGADPMFSISNGAMSASIAEVAYGIPPYQTLVSETRNGATRQLLRGQAPLRFAFMGGSALPLFVADPRPTTARQPGDRRY